MKRSTQVFLGAMGILAASWGVDRALHPPPPPLPACPIGPDGKPVVTPGCTTDSQRSSSSSSSNSRSFSSSGSSSSSGWGWGSSGSDSTSHGSGGVGHATSSGGFGSMARGFSGGG